MKPSTPKGWKYIGQQWLWDLKEKEILILMFDLNSKSFYWNPTINTGGDYSYVAIREVSE